jgi:hypothetical protein
VDIFVRTFGYVTESDAWVPLSRRDAGLAIDETLYEDVPAHLRGPLAAWLERFDNDLRRSFKDEPDSGSRAAEKWRIDLLLRLRMEDRAFEERASADQLDLLDAMLRWSPSSDTALRRHADALEELFTLGGSAWRVNASRDGLERRLERTIAQAARSAIENSNGDVSQHLEAAWVAAYGRRPDPDKVLNESIRAIEAIACPMVEPARAASGKATLGTVIGQLKNAGHRWELVIPGLDGAPTDVTSLVAMLTLLWQGQVSRHAGAPKSRRQKQSEAEAAVHLTATLVQWLQNGVLRPKST